MQGQKCHIGQSWEQLNGIFTATKEVQHKHQKMAWLECTNSLQLLLLSSVVYSICYSCGRVQPHSGTSRLNIYLKSVAHFKANYRKKKPNDDQEWCVLACAAKGAPLWKTLCLEMLLLHCWLACSCCESRIYVEEMCACQHSPWNSESVSYELPSMNKRCRGWFKKYSTFQDWHLLIYFKPQSFKEYLEDQNKLCVRYWYYTAS